MVRSFIFLDVWPFCIILDYFIDLRRKSRKDVESLEVDNLVVGVYLSY